MDPSYQRYADEPERNLSTGYCEPEPKEDQPGMKLDQATGLWLPETVRRNQKIGFAA